MDNERSLYNLLRPYIPDEIIEEMFMKLEYPNLMSFVETDINYLKFVRRLSFWRKYCEKYSVAQAFNNNWYILVYWMIKLDYNIPGYIIYNNENILCLKVALLYAEIENLDVILQRACLYGYTEVVRLLLYFSNRHNMDFPTATRAAVSNNYVEIVKLLLQEGTTDPSVINNLLIKQAIRKNNREMVNILLENTKTDITANGGEIILLLLNKGYLKIVKSLLENPKIVSKLTDSQIKHYSKYNFLIQK